MGDERFYPEERSVREVSVGGFWIDERPVTVAEFRRFVKQTGHVTVAERALEPADYPGTDPALLTPGSLVFRPTPGPVDLSDVRNIRRPSAPQADELLPFVQLRPVTGGDDVQLLPSQE